MSPEVCEKLSGKPAASFSNYINYAGRSQYTYHPISFQLYITTNKFSNMCHGAILTYRCCGQQRNLFQIGGECEDGFCGTVWGGNKIDAPRHCRSCRIKKARAERRSGRQYINNIRRAKAVLEYLRRERATPFVDEEAQERALIAESARNWELYERGLRLHPFVVGSHSSQSIISTIRRHFDLDALANREDHFSTIRPYLFEECIRRQEEITASHRSITPVDRAFAFQIVVDGGIDYPEERIDEPEVATTHAPAVVQTEHSDPEMAALNDDELFMIDTIGFQSDHDIIALPTAAETHTPMDAGFVDASAEHYSEDLEDTGYNESHEVPLPVVSFPEWLAEAANEDNPTLSSEAALERDLDDYEHSYLALNVSWPQLMDFRETRINIQNRPYDFFPQPRLIFDPPTLSFAAWLCVQQQTNSGDFFRALETYSTYIEEVATPEQQAAFRESRERRAEANRRFFNYEMLEEDSHDFYRPYYIITPSRPSQWIRSTSRTDIMNFLNDLAQGRHNPIHAPVTQLINEFSPQDGDSRSSNRPENGDSEDALSISEPVEQREHHCDTPTDNTSVDLAEEDAPQPVLDDDSESEVENEDPVRARADWFGTNSVWPPDRPANTRAQNARSRANRTRDPRPRNARTDDAVRRLYLPSVRP